MSNITLSSLGINILEGGPTTAVASYNFLKSLLEMLTPNFGYFTTENIPMQIYFGNYNNEFFVGTEDIFNEENQIINFSLDDINDNYKYDYKVARVLKEAFQSLKSLGSSGIYSAKVLFLRDEIKTSVINQKKYICITDGFQKYAIEASTITAEKIKKSKIGLIIQSKLYGYDLLNMTEREIENYDNIQSPSEVFLFKNNFVSVDDAFLTQDLVDNISFTLNKYFQLINSSKPALEHTSKTPNKEKTLSYILKTYYLNFYNILDNYDEYYAYVMQNYINESNNSKDITDLRIELYQNLDNVFPKNKLSFEALPNLMSMVNDMVDYFSSLINYFSDTRYFVSTSNGISSYKNRYDFSYQSKYGIFIFDKFELKQTGFYVSSDWIGRYKNQIYPIKYKKIPYDKSAYVSYESFDPPVPGDIKVLNSLKSDAGKNDYFIFVDSKPYKKLSFVKKIEFVKRLFPSYAYKISNTSNITKTEDILIYLQKQGYSRVFFVVDGRRYKGISDTIKPKNKINFYYKDIRIYTTQQSTDNKFKTSDEARRYALANNYDKFRKIYSKNLSEYDIDELYRLLGGIIK